MAEFDPATVEQFKKFRDAKRRAALARTGQAVGGGAETLRTGRSAAETFAAREPQYDTMSRQEKMEASIPLYGQLAQEEQFYSAEARKEREAVMDQILASYRAMLQAETAKMRESNASARTSAQLGLREKDALVGEDYRLRQELLEGDRQTQALAKGAAQSAKADLDRLRDKAEADVHKELSTGPSAATYDDMSAGERKQLIDRVLSTNADFQASKDAIVGRYTDTLLAQDRPPGQAAAGLELFVGQTGAGNLEELAKRNPVIREKLQERDEALKSVEDKLTEDILERAKVTRRAWGSDGNMDQLAAKVMDVASAYGQAAQTTGQAPAGQPGEAGAPAGGGGAPGGYLGVPGVQPVTDSRGRILQTLEMIDEYPEHPPLMEAKKALMGSPKFQEFKQARGYTDDDLAFRFMRQELRQKIKQDKRDTLQAARERRKKKLTSRITPPKSPAAPVTGATERTSEVKSGEAK